MVGPRVGMELVRLAEAVQFGVELPHVVLRRVGVNLPEMEQHGAIDIACQIKRRRFARAPGGHQVAAVVRNHGLEVRVGSSRQPGHTAAHAESGDADPVALHRVVAEQPVDGGVHIRDDVRVAEERRRAGPRTSGGRGGNRFFAMPVVKVGRDRRIPVRRQPVADVLDEGIHARGMLRDYYGWIRRGETGAAGRHAGIHVHFVPTYVDLFPKTCHWSPPNSIALRDTAGAAFHPSDLENPIQD